MTEYKYDFLKDIREDIIDKPEQDQKRFEEFTKEEQEVLVNLEKTMIIEELKQAEELRKLCNNRFQYARTHSAYIEDWEKTKANMEENLKTNNIPKDVSSKFYEELINISERAIENKLRRVRIDFVGKFGDDINNYLGKNGKTAGCLGVFLCFIIISGFFI
ncbi:MAG TPA: hypothetical protein P5230_04370 [Candidatus Magasanikbacteria bacterium]|nr:hypothetical protein [Candidatus Magasanikbacteria bacterium]